MAVAVVRILETLTYSRRADMVELKVRKADETDLERLRPFAHVFHKMCCFRDKKIPGDLVDRYFEHMTNDPNAVILTHDHGALGASVERAEMGFGFILRERFFMSAPKTGRVLLDAFHALARTKKVDLTALSLICKDNVIPPKQHQQYIDMGYELTEAVYVRKVDTCP